MRSFFRFRVSSRAVSHEIRKWGSLSFLAGLGQFADNLPWLISNIMIGHVSTVDLAALGLVEIWLYSFLEVCWGGLGLTESVLVSQAHGKKRLVAMRGWAVISLVYMMLGSAIMSLLCLTVSPTLKAFGMNPQLVDIGKVYAYYIIPAIWIEGINVVASTYMCSFQAPLIPTAIRLFSVLVDIIVTYVFVFGIGDTPSVFTNALIGNALGWIASSGFTLVMNVITLIYLWGRELEYGDDQDDEDMWADETRSIDKQEREKVERERASSAAATAAGRDRQKSLNNSLPLGVGRQASGFRKNSSGFTTDAVVKVLTAGGIIASNASVMDTDNGSGGNSLNERLLSGPGSGPRKINTGTAVDSDSEDEDGEDLPNTARADLQAIAKFVWNTKRWTSFNKQAGPNSATVLLQCSVFTFLSFLAANLGTVQIAAHNQNIAMLEVAFTFVGGMAEGTAVRVGYHIGRSNIEGAKLVVQLAFAINLLLGFAAGFIGYYFRFELADCLSTDPDVRAVSVTLAPLLWGTFAFFSVGDQALSVLEGQGRAVEQFLSFMIGSVGVTIPLALISYFATNWGLEGLWGSLFIGFLLSEVLALVLVVWFSDWKRLVADAGLRTEEGDEDAATKDASGEEARQLLLHNQRGDEAAEKDALLLDSIIQISRTVSRDSNARSEALRGLRLPEDLEG